MSTNFREINPEEQSAISKYVLTGKKTLAEALNIDPQSLEHIYSVAYGFYQSGNYKDAELLFRMLVMQNTKDMRFSMALGAARQALKDYPSAIDAYIIATLASDDKDPAPYYYIGLCLMKQGEQEKAKISFELALERWAEEGLPAKECESNKSVHKLSRELLKELNSSEQVKK